MAKKKQIIYYLSFELNPTAFISSLSSELYGKDLLINLNSEDLKILRRKFKDIKEK